MLRIMQVGYSFAIGGSEMVVRDIAIGLAKAGWPSAVCALEYDGPLNAELVERGVTTTVIAKQGREIFGPMFRLWRAFRAFRPNVVHTHHVYELIYAWPGALLCGAKLVHTEHEFHSLAGDRRRIMLRLLARLCCKVTAVNEETAAYLRDIVKIPVNKVVTIVNGVDLQRFSSTQRSLARNRLALPSSAPLAGIVARLEPPKNHAFLFRAFRAVVDQQPDALLLVVGDGNQRSGLETLSKELGLAGHIIFLGARRDIPDILAALDLFVLSSDREGLPVALLEAMAAALPVVATAVGGIPAVIEHGVSGYLVNPNDEEQLAGGMNSILADIANGQQFGENGKAFISRNFSFDVVVKCYMKLYAGDLH